MIVANNSYLLAFDNRSGRPVCLSDALSRAPVAAALPSRSSIRAGDMLGSRHFPRA